MSTRMSRRELVAALPATLGTALLGHSPGASAAAVADLYRVDDEQRILAVAREIVEEDWVATLITIDEHGMPRARSVGVSTPEHDMALWISTRRRSRKVEQIRRNPRATLHFARDALSENLAGAYYASFMGEATVHLDPETYGKHLPAPEILKENWPDYPDDYAAICFKPQWLEVYGRGIRGRAETWQPQGVVLR